VPRLIRLGAVAVAGVAVGIYSLRVAREHSGFAFAGSAPAGVALLGAGWALIGVGLGSRWRRPDSRFGLFLVGAGFAWFVVEWANPGIGSALAFTAGLVLYAACPPLAAHAALSYPGGRLRPVLARPVLAFAYAGAILVLGALPALVFDPAAEGCSACPRNLLLVEGDPGMAADLYRLGIYLGVTWTLLLGALVAGKLVLAAPAERRVAGLVLGACFVYLGLVCSTFAVNVDRGYLSNDELSRRLWLGQAVALAALALAVVWGWVRALRLRSDMARLVLELAHSPPPGGLRDVLADVLGDSDLILAYPMEGERYVDARGRRVSLPVDGRMMTPIMSGGRPIAALVHEPGLLDDPELPRQAAAAARLALENERLQAEARARLEELRASRVRIVAAGDAERRRLERDLHDGAQQHLVSLSLKLQLLHSEKASAGGHALAPLARAERELRRAIRELRELAHGIYPAVLADEGLAAAVEALREEARVPIEIRSLPVGRCAPLAESAAYAVVLETAKAATTRLAVAATCVGGKLVVETETSGLDGLELVELEDRVGALGGELRVERSVDCRVTIHASLPCGS
jgi:signal transduction histidine kinase